MYDIIIIGGGIAGLYSAYKITKLDSSKKILLLEANDHLGGRANNVNFHGQSIPIGAGVGRKNKDKLLIQLLDDLNLKYNEFTTGSQYASTINPSCNVKEMFMYLKHEYNHEIDKNKNFKQYAKPKLDNKYFKNAYENFIVCSGYTDYENEDVYDTLHYYGFDDNYRKWNAMGISWKNLVDTLSRKIGSHNIKKSSYVKRINKNSETEYEIISSQSKYLCKKIIIATEIEGLRKLLPTETLYNQIKGQPFLRIYGKFSKSSSLIMHEKCEKTTIVPGPLHKIIPMNPEKGIYMIAYTDNAGAKLLEKNRENRELICKLLETALEIPQNTLELDDIIDFYWENGTHYFLPLKGGFKTRKEYCNVAQKPEKNIRVVGELISMNQGWVEGALESVENVIEKEWIKNG
uniref:Amine oxidase domain-containing protein n=1 Tax=viral metagenome TaxID=1070528 RepID=A0A6C0JK28_9ZZZZ